MPGRGVLVGDEVLAGGRAWPGSAAPARAGAGSDLYARRPTCKHAGTDGLVLLLAPAQRRASADAPCEPQRYPANRGCLRGLRGYGKPHSGGHILEAARWCVVPQI